MLEGIHSFAELRGCYILPPMRHVVDPFWTPSSWLRLSPSCSVGWLIGSAWSASDFKIVVRNVSARDTDRQTLHLLSRDCTIQQVQVEGCATSPSCLRSRCSPTRTGETCPPALHTRKCLDPRRVAQASGKVGRPSLPRYNIAHTAGQVASCLGFCDRI